jgi:hypothetical protein
LLAEFGFDGDRLLMLLVLKAMVTHQRLITEFQHGTSLVTIL